MTKWIQMQNNAQKRQESAAAKSFGLSACASAAKLRSIHLELSALYLQQARVEIFLVERWALFSLLFSSRSQKSLSLNLSSALLGPQPRRMTSLHGSKVQNTKSLRACLEFCFGYAVSAATV
jgi:hypothetical protein